MISSEDTQSWKRNVVKHMRIGSQAGCWKSVYVCTANQEISCHLVQITGKLWNLKIIENPDLDGDNHES